MGKFKLAVALGVSLGLDGGTVLAKLLKNGSASIAAATVTSAVPVVSGESAVSLAASTKSLAQSLAADQAYVAQLNENLQYCSQKTVTRYRLRSGKRRCLYRDLEPKQAVYAQQSFQELLAAVQMLD
ncbi:MAG TPA: hypothetical protein VJJ83_00665, partial [Candidatus Babeliales bacterium]|nr:hypothetical protein [Candidatus Babeliales bacterium]